MSEPPSSTPQPPSHHQPLPFSPTTTNREYRKGNWTLHETLTIITAKKLDEERRSKPNLSASTSKPSELRWKWVENFCWAHGCFRSQNQCNDKWDNLLRDYKKIRDYQSRSIPKHGGSSYDNPFPSYWTMDRHQRKFYNLPSNMPLEVFEALDEVVQRRYHNNNTQQQPEQQQQQSLPPPPPPPLVTAPEGLPEETGGLDPPAISEGSESSSATESSDKQDSGSSKRRKDRNIGASIKRSASMIAQAIRNCEQKKDKRHQELMEYEQRRLQLEENRNEVNRQGMANLVMAVTKLSSAIQSLASADQT